MFETKQWQVWAVNARTQERIDYPGVIESRFRSGAFAKASELFPDVEPLPSGKKDDESPWSFRARRLTPEEAQELQGKTPLGAARSLAL